MDQEQNRRQLVESIKNLSHSLVHTDKDQLSEDEAKEIGKQLWNHTSQAHKDGYIDLEMKRSLEEQIQRFDTQRLPQIGVGVCKRLKEAVME